ncbi:MAG: hypothetical protein WC670_05535 [Pseudolabrys sp.]|jgi:hypothetical protein
MNHNEGFFVGGFTFLLVFVTAWLVKATVRLADDARVTAERQSAETRTLQRAYLNVLPKGIETTRGGAVIGQVAIRNVGHLPARKVSISARIGWFENRTEDAFDDGQVPEQSLVLPAGAEIPRGTGALPRGRGVLSSGKGFIYVWGRVTYEDGFDTNRWVMFCHRYPCEASIGVPGTSQGIEAKYARHHAEHNDAN